MKQEIKSLISVLALSPLAGCVSHDPLPIDPKEVLGELEEVEWTPPEDGADAGDGPGASAAGPDFLAAFAVTTNPGLATVRAELGVRAALLVEAGLLPDPELGWDAMDLLASQIVTGSSSSIDVLSGLSLMFPLLRFGERDARIDAAAWRVEEVRRAVVAGEWALTRAVYVAFEEAIAADLAADQADELAALAEETASYFSRAREFGAVTEIQANLALGEMQSVRLQGIRAQARVRRARQELNALLGLPPSTWVELASRSPVPPVEAMTSDVDSLTAHALSARPDLAVLQASYEASEADLQRAVASQYPSVSLGTGIGLTLPIFREFGRAEMETALARREGLRLQFKAALHAAREEIAALHAEHEFVEREVALIETELLPNAERNLVLSEEAFQEGEVTLLEILALQRALVEARTRHAESVAELNKKTWELLAASGWLLAPKTAASPTDEEDD